MESLRKQLADYRSQASLDHRAGSFYAAVSLQATGGRRSAADTPVGLTEAMCAAVKQTAAVMALLLFAVLFGYEPRCCLALGALFVM